MNTITVKNRFALITPFLAKYYGGVVGTKIEKPLPTITARDHNVLITPYLTKYYGTNIGSSMKEPIGTVTATGQHHALMMPFLTKYHGSKSGETRGQVLNKPLRTVDTQNRFGLVSAFMVKYYGCGIGQAVTEPLHTITAKDRLGLVTIYGQDYQIVDIGLRMLSPRELALAQGFPADYVLTGTKTSQVHKIGNSVPPPMSRALAGANVELVEIKERQTA